MRLVILSSIRDQIPCTEFYLIIAKKEIALKKLIIFQR